MHQHLNTLYQGQSLTRDAARDAFGQVVRGEVDPIVLASLLTALKIKGETPEEIAGAAEALLAEARDFPRPDYAFCDIVGTGGDGLNTINVSTTSALVAAACGLKVAKHGNRSVSSKSGSSDLLDKMGIKLDMSPAQARRCLDELGVCFLFAPQYHAGVRHAMPVRQALKTRTLFNVLGPLINPARPSFQLMGVYAPELVGPIAKTLLALGLKTVWWYTAPGSMKWPFMARPRWRRSAMAKFASTCSRRRTLASTPTRSAPSRAVSLRRTAPSPPPFWRGVAPRPTTPPSQPTWRRCW